MKKILTVSVAAIVLSGVAGAKDINMYKQEAKGVIKQFGGTLKGKLVAAMQAGGPANAITVCSKEAPAIAEQLSTQHGVQLTRVSLKNRNLKMGVPSDWQRKVLQDFDAKQAAGTEAKKIAFAQVTEDKKQFRMMKAIPTGGVCLACHGETIAPEVQAKLDALYPEDKATGYKAGQVRGAFVYVKDL